MINKMISMDRYFEYLYILQKDMINKTLHDKNKIWLNHYCNVIKEGFTIENLPRLLALIHPDFYYDKMGAYIGKSLSWETSNSFSSDITHTSMCTWGYEINRSCVFNKDRYIRGKCEADHYWPKYLGGPSIKENRRILCKYHNNMKGSDILNYD